jgi:diguanylate cyclase (GGDEF)-like protein
MVLTSKVKTGESVSDAQFRQFQIFNEVDLKRIRPLLDQCRKDLLNPGDVLLRPEFGNNSMYLLLSGKVSVSLESLDAPPLLDLGAGECIGEMSVFDGRNPSAYVKAMEPCEVLIIESDILWQLIDSSHSLCRNLLYFLSNRLRSGNDIVTISKSKEKEQQHAANSDALTGLNNRRWLQDTVAKLKGHELIERLPLVVLMLDVDHFKRYNDAYGHKSGDLVLQMVAHTMRKSLRPSDMLARYGGEEFIVLLPRTPAKQAEQVAERLRIAVADCEISAEQGEALPSVTISIGVSPVAEHETLDDAIEAADKALYDAKSNGRNCVAMRSTKRN